MGFWDAEWMTAAGGVLIGVMTVVLSRGKNKPPDAATPSVHQEAIRPETGSEIKSAEALQSAAHSLKLIAATGDKLERYASILMDRRETGRRGRPET